MSDLLKGAYLNRSGATIGADKVHIVCYGCEGASNESVAAELLKAIELYNSMQWRNARKDSPDSYPVEIIVSTGSCHRKIVTAVNRTHFNAVTEDYRWWMPTNFLPPMPEVK